MSNESPITLHFSAGNSIFLAGAFLCLVWLILPGSVSG
jgi:hypothetical protein